MIILSWNVRGLGESVKRAGVRDFCLLHHADIMCFQETKLEEVCGVIMKSLAVSQDTTWTYLAAVGSLLVDYKLVGMHKSGYDSQNLRGLIL